jgi:flavodoxin
MKTLIVYYSRSGNNRFLAEKLAKDISADIQSLRPRVNAFALLAIASLTHLSLGNRKLKTNIADYDAVIMCGPIWMGQLISPLRDFLNKHRKHIKKLYFMTCCGGGEDSKDSKFGYSHVFNQAQLLMDDAWAGAEAFPIDLIVPSEMKGKSEEIMKLKLSPENFKGLIAERYAAFLRTIR